MKLKYIPKYIKDVIDNAFCNLFFKDLNIMDSSSTIDYIKNNKASIARYGDGELRLIRGIDIEFQTYDKVLAQKLKSVKSTNNCILCLPDIYDDTRFNKDFIIEAEYEYWKKFKRRRCGLFKKYFRKNDIIGDAFISRFYLRYNDKSHIGDYVKKLKSIWEDRNIIIVEGQTSQIGVGNDILNNAKSIKRIICPNVNAFGCYDAIYSAVKKHYTQDDLVLLALGPTATVLAYELSKENIWALDMGHFDIEYEWFLAKTEHKIPVKNKHVNEIGDMGSQDKNNKEYLNQIVEEIKND